MKLYAMQGRNQETTADQQLRAIMIEKFRRFCPVLEYIEFAQEGGNSGTYLKDSDAEAGDTNWRTSGENWPDNRSDPDEGVFAYKIFGSKVQTGREVSRRFDGKVGRFHAREVGKFAERLAKNMQYAMFNASASSNAKAIDGILTQHAALSVARGETFGDTLSTQAKKEALINKIKYAIEDVEGATVVCMPLGIKDALTTLAGQLTNVGLNYFKQSIDAIGSTNVPILVPGRNAAGTQTLPFDASNNGKIVIWRSAEESGVAGWSTTGFDAAYYGQQGSVVESDIEVDVDVRITNPQSIYVIDGIQYS